MNTVKSDPSVCFGRMTTVTAYLCIYIAEIHQVGGKKGGIREQSDRKVRNISSLWRQNGVLHPTTGSRLEQIMLPRC